MKLLKHSSSNNAANSYIIGPDKGGDAILIDPSVIDINLLDMIEDNNFYIKYILITHSHNQHTQALRTIKKIYDAELYSFYSHIGNFDCVSLVDGEVLSLSGTTVKVHHIPGHSVDSLIYEIESMVFVGDVISSGSLGSTSSRYEQEILIDGIGEKLLNMPENTMVLPGHGPPSLISTEKKLFNLYVSLK